MGWRRRSKPSRTNAWSQADRQEQRAGDDRAGQQVMGTHGISSGGSAPWWHRHFRGRRPYRRNRTWQSPSLTRRAARVVDSAAGARWSSAAPLPRTLAGAHGDPRPAPEVRSYGVQPVIAGDPESASRAVAARARPRSVDHGDGDRVIQRDHRVVREPQQHLVQLHDLRPIGLLGARRLVVDGGDRGLELIGPDRPAWEGVGDQGDALGDRRRHSTGSGPARPSAPAHRRPSVRAGRLASVSSISASRPATSPSSGSSACTIRASRIASVGELAALQGRARTVAA